MSGDPVTRDQITETMIEFCPLRTVLKKDKPCPYFGASGNCSDCMFSWVAAADEVLKVAKARRASYEREYQKAKGYKQELDEANSKLSLLSGFFVRIGEGFKAIRELDDFIDEHMDVQKEGESVDEQSQDSSDNTEGAGGGEDD